VKSTTPRRLARTFLAGESAESLATLDRALTSPEISARHRGRLLVLAARTHCHLGEAEKAGRVAAGALEAATEAGDSWAMGWALHVLTLVTTMQGHRTYALPLFDRARAVTESDPALDRPAPCSCRSTRPSLWAASTSTGRPSPWPGKPGDLADRIGTTCRLAQAHYPLGQLLFETGRWDEALAELEVVPEDLKEPGVACCELGIAAVIGFHRGEMTAARRHPAAVDPHTERLGRRHMGPLALDREQEGALPEAPAALADAFTPNTEDIGEIEDLLADAIRLATQVGDMGYRTHSGRSGRRPRGRIGDSASAGERAVLPRLARP
jgi:hypothetical protein